MIEALLVAGLTGLGELIGTTEELYRVLRASVPGFDLGSREVGDALRLLKEVAGFLVARPSPRCWQVRLRGLVDPESTIHQRLCALTPGRFKLEAEPDPDAKLFAAMRGPGPKRPTGPSDVVSIPTPSPAPDAAHTSSRSTNAATPSTSSAPPAADRVHPPSNAVTSPSPPAAPPGTTPPTSRVLSPATNTPAASPSALSSPPASAMASSCAAAPNEASAPPSTSATGSAPPPATSAGSPIQMPLLFEDAFGRPSPRAGDAAARPMVGGASTPVHPPLAELPSVQWTVGEFWTMWLDERDFLFRMCLGWLRGNRCDAEDVLSKGALNAAEYVRCHPTPVQRFRPWMLRILHNLCIDVIRARTRDARLERCAPVEASRVVGELRTPQVPDQALLSREIAASIAVAASSLPPRLYEVFEQRFIKDLPYEEISQKLMISPQSARKRIQHVREILRLELLGFSC